MDDFASKVIDGVYNADPDSILISYSYEAIPNEEIFTHIFYYKADDFTRPELQDLVEWIRDIDVDAPKRVEFLQFDTRFMIIVVITT